MYWARRIIDVLPPAQYCVFGYAFMPRFLHYVSFYVIFKLWTKSDNNYYFQLLESIKWLIFNLGKYNRYISSRDL